MIKRLDFYGIKPFLTVSNQKSYSTSLGGLASIFTFFLCTGAIYLFGQDFFHKSNPRVASQESVYDKPKIIYPTSSNFTVFFELTDRTGQSVNIEDLKIKLFFSYRYAVKDENNDFKRLINDKLEAVKCSKTAAVDNFRLDSYNLDRYYCLNWEKLIEDFKAPVPFGGFSDDDQYSLFRIRVTNYAFDSESKDDPKDKRSSFEEILEEVALRRFTLKIYYPSFLFDMDSVNNPMKQGYDVFIYNINTEISRIDRHFFESSFLEDDQGWIFKDVKQIEGVRHNMFQTELRLFDFEPESREDIKSYTFLGYLNKKHTVFRRNYMKIQELAALVGGFLKVISIFLKEIVGFFGNFDMEKLMIKENESKLKLIQFQGNSSISQVSQVIDNKKENKVQIEFWTYLKGILGLKSREILEYKLKKKEILGKLDLCFFLRFFKSLEDYLLETAANQRSMVKKIFT